MFRTLCFCSLLLATGLVHGEIKNKGWWRNAVFYQIYPRSFMDSNNDGVGDLKGKNHFKFVVEITNNFTCYYEYGSHIPFNFKLITDVNQNSSASDFKRIIEAWMAHTPSTGSANWVLGNHDRSRTASRYPERSIQMNMLPMILPGVAVTYYGEEIGMVDKSDISWEDTQDPQACNAGKDKYRSRSRDPNRTPFQWDSNENSGFSKGNRTWLPVHDNYKGLNLENQKNTPQQSLYKMYRTLIQLRNTSRALQHGELKMKVMKFNTDYCYNCELLAISREVPGETVSLLMSFSPAIAVRVELKDVMTLYKNTYSEVDAFTPKRYSLNAGYVYVFPWEGRVISSSD
ncbi:hypothetical protein HZH66_009532 [Vespula vulgaris]|uniref:Glycosyl hydrolase family 13 catalytic domain-containing protein n=1 Tax=Vespula vulgaris TaxID=7454 RepID=A0A834MZN4_VESVU|nr:hypothetical protein HZH66_009532 [Vespula vulgaris]